MNQNEMIFKENRIITKLNDIWQLGNHRLMCGDSTDINHIKKLINNNKIDMLFADPPYGMNKIGYRNNRIGGTIQPGNNFIPFNDNIDNTIKVFNLIQHFDIPIQIWWGANNYASHLPNTNNWIVWDKRIEDKQKDRQSDCELAWCKSQFKSIRIFRHLWKGLIKDSERMQKRIHPTQKPIALAEWCFEELRVDNNILDLFGGSGSTLIACQNTNRTCYMMELHPYYCDTILKRYIKEFNKQPVNLLNNKTYDELSYESK